MVGQHVQLDLVRYVERRLDAAGRARVEVHLAGCAACRAAAAETLALVDGLQAMPAALGRLPALTRRDWAGIWARARAPAGPPSLPRLSFCLSLVMAAFSLVTLLPPDLARQPAAVTAGMVQTPGAVAFTPRALPSRPDAGWIDTAPATVAGDEVSAAGPIPAPTPMPGPLG